MMSMNRRLVLKDEASKSAKGVPCGAYPKKNTAWEACSTSDGGRLRLRLLALRFRSGLERPLFDGEVFGPVLGT